MLRHCWPGGIGDRTDPVALEWVSRWRPQCVESPGFECRCVSGYCGVCNWSPSATRPRAPGGLGVLAPA